jgi:hypothetical protein
MGFSKQSRKSCLPEAIIVSPERLDIGRCPSSWGKKYDVTLHYPKSPVGSFSIRACYEIGVALRL